MHKAKNTAGREAFARRGRGGKASPPGGVAAAPTKPRANARGSSESRRPRAEPVSPAVTPEDMLARAMSAATPRSRAMWARRGLVLGRDDAPLDRTTHSMLLRQLYLSYFESRRFREAAGVADEMVDLRVLPDVAHQDAARAKQALGDVDAAAGHLRLAARLGPPSRKAFHWWTLGSLYFLAGRYDQAISAMTRAARWGTTDKPLYQGHRAVVLCASGQKVPDLGALIERLAEVPSGQGYGRFVLGQMAFYERRLDEARRYLEAFVRRSTSGRIALAIALEGEVNMARALLRQMSTS